MPCWTDYIGIRDDCYTGTTPGSGLYINDIPGVSVKVASDIAGDEFKNGVDLLQNIITASQNEVKAKAAQLLTDYVRLAPLVEVDHAGEFLYNGDANDFLAVSNENRGVEICINQKRQLNGLRIYITTIDVYTNTAGARNVLITERGNTTTTKAVTLVAGQVQTVDVYEEYTTDKVWVNWNTSDIAVNDSRLKVGNCKGCGSTGAAGRTYNHAKVRGLNDAGEYSNRTYGISVNFQIRCSQEEILCAFRPNLKYIMWKEAGLRFIQEALASERFNAQTNLRREVYGGMRDELLLELRGNPDNSNIKSLWQEFADGARSSLKQFNSPCVDCRTPRARVAML